MSTTPPTPPGEPTDPWNQPSPGYDPTTPGDGPPTSGYGAPGYDPSTPPPLPYGQSAYGQPPAAQPPYGQAPFGQPPYGQPGYGYPPAQIEHPQGTTILVLGILGIVFCPLFAPIAWVMGNTALREVDAQPGRYSNRGIVQAGRLCGMIYSLFLLLLLVGFILLIVVAGVSSSST